MYCRAPERNLRELGAVTGAHAAAADHLLQATQHRDAEARHQGRTPGEAQ